MIAADALVVERQPSQRVQLGLEATMTAEIAGDLARGGEAWTAVREGRPIACWGIQTTFHGPAGDAVQGVVWAILSAGIGAAHLAITRAVKRMIADSRLVRIEALVRVATPAEPAWAKLVGLEPDALLRRYGALSEDHMLYTRIR